MGIHQATAQNSKTTQAAQTCSANREVWRKMNAKGTEAQHLLLLLFAFQEQDEQLLEAGAAGGSEGLWDVDPAGLRHPCIPRTAETSSTEELQFQIHWIV